MHLLQYHYLPLLRYLSLFQLLLRRLTISLKIIFGPPEILPQDIVYDPIDDLIGDGQYGSVYKGKQARTLSTLHYSSNVSLSSRFLSPIYYQSVSYMFNEGRCRGLEVAVKKPHQQSLTDAQLTSFRHEVEMMRYILLCVSLSLCYTCTRNINYTLL